MRYGTGLLILQAAVISYCEYEAESFGRTAHGSWDRYAVHTVLRVQLSGGRVALVLFLLALANMIVVSLRLWRDRQSSDFARDLCVALPFALLPVVVQIAIIPLYAGFCFE